MHSTQFEARDPALNRMLAHANLCGFFTSSILTAEAATLTASKWLLLDSSPSQSNHKT
jgi:hypothetical protein